MIKKFSIYLMIVGFTLTMAVSCDKIEGPYTEPAEIEINTEKNVLLEDYTGHLCVNCPDAAVIASNLKELYGDNLVVMAVHAGYFSNPMPSGDFTDDFRTTEGTEWDTYFGISNAGNPNGMINRKGYSNTTHILSPSAWADAVAAELNEPLKVGMAIINTYNSTSRLLKTSVNIKFLEQLNKDLKLVVAITEDGIIAPQKNNNDDIGSTPVILDYEHNHVLRAVLNTTWGTTVASAGTPNLESVRKSFTYTLTEDMVPENCSVVAFVYDNATKEVLQVVQKEL